MSNEELKGVTAETPKKIRRGVTNETKAVSNLKFHEKDAASNGLFIGHLKEVTLNYSTGKEGTNFTGLKMPYLTFHFVSQHAKPEEQRHVYNTLFPIPSNISTIPGGDSDWQVNNVFAWIKHMLDTYYLKGRQLTEIEEDALSLDFYDTDENGEYVMVEPQVVLDSYGTLFANVITILEGRFNLADGETPKCSYKDANGKPITVWMKLLRHRKSKKGWVNVTPNGDLGFDSFIGTGAIEVYKGNGTLPSILRIDSSKESITPKETKKEPTIGGVGMPIMMGGGIVPPMMSDGIPTDNSAFAAAGDDNLPF